MKKLATFAAAGLVAAAVWIYARPEGPRATCEETRLNEECLHGGSEAAEAAEFAGYAERIREIAERQTRRGSERPPGRLRAFHAKGHACLAGSLIVHGGEGATGRPPSDPRSRFGVFREPGRRWPLWARFSGGVGWPQADVLPDVRGLALKLMGVEGAKFLPDEARTQDFLLTNARFPIGADAAEFMRFAEANSRGYLPLIEYVLNLLPPKVRTGRGAIDGLPLPLPPASLASQTYWSAVPYRLGSGQAVKWKLAPRTCDFTREVAIGGTPDGGWPHVLAGDYLRRDVLRRAAQTGLCFELLAQFQTDPRRTPIEDTLVEWKESESPPVALGLVVLPQQEHGGESQDRFCDRLSYTPWHAIEEHRPLSHINRARRAVYDASRAQRGGGYEPTSLTY